jgi:hypothetical protein
MVNNLRKKGPGLLQQIKMVAVNHHLACDVVQPRTPGLHLRPGGFTIAAAAYQQRRRAQRRKIVERVVVIVLSSVKIGAQKRKK